MSALGKFIGGLICSCAVVGAIAWGFYAWIVLGLIGTIEAATADPIVAKDLAMGIVWMLFLALLTAFFVGVVGFLVGGQIISASGGSKPRFPMRRRSRRTGFLG